MTCLSNYMIIMIKFVGRVLEHPLILQYKRANAVVESTLRVAKLLGLDKNAAAISANQATIKTIGTNMNLIGAFA